jgi:hypothetical protein
MDDWREWAKAAGIRALKTAAQFGVVLVGSDMVNITTLDWPNILGCMAAGAVVSMLTSVAGLPEVQLRKELADGTPKQD